jgi:HEAT repeat protein
LGRLGQASEAVVNALLAALRDKESNVRGRAAAALGRLGRPRPEVLRALRDRLDDQESCLIPTESSLTGTTVGEAAFIALGQLVTKMYEQGMAEGGTTEALKDTESH